MVHINRIEQLFGVVIIAYTWAYLVGIAANLKVKAIRILNNGRHAISMAPMKNLKVFISLRFVVL